MNEHSLFYYPYASLTSKQLALMKVAALYFDKLYLLDPVGASWDTVGADHEARQAIKMLSAENILETVTPADVLAKYARSLTETIRQDMGDREFLELCEAQSRTSGKQRWTLSLAKVPLDVQTDHAMRDLMGNFARGVLSNSQAHTSVTDDYFAYDETEVGAILEQAMRLGRTRELAPEVQVYNEYREGYDHDIEYRYADFPLALGEAIMMNHALCAGMMHANATPITDDSFHSRALSLKLQRATQHPTIQQIQEERARQHKMNLLAVATLKDTQLNLPILNPEISLTEVLEYRLAHKDALQEARTKLGWMAREIKAEPWSNDFMQELEHKTIPDIHKQLDEVSKARDSWLESGRAKSFLKGGTVILGGASIVLSLFAAPFVPTALAVTGLGLTVAKDVAIPGAEWWLDWRGGKKTMQENGLHYLLEL
jgi:hypothetical protein